MKPFKVLIWIGFLAIMLIFFLQGYSFKEAGLPGIVSFEFANAIDGRFMLSSWKNEGLLSTARWMIWLDFAYIFFYVAIIITLSNRQVRKEPSIGLNALLRGNFFFAVAAGFLDVIENIGLLYNIQNWTNSYFNVSIVACLKFILVGWTILIWLISFVKSKI